MFIGGPGAEEQDLLHFRPDPELLFNGPEGVVFRPSEDPWWLPRNDRELGLVGGAMAFGSVAAFLFSRTVLPHMRGLLSCMFG